jgi:crossover junction endodeoxyribonuclease RuvC
MSRFNCIMGVDPGLSGAVAFYWPSQGRLIVEDMPAVASQVDTANLAALIGQHGPDAAIIELVGAMPKQGVSSTFKFGVSYGAVRGVLSALGVPYRLIAPSKWKRHFTLPSDKEEARARALQLWPVENDRFSRKKDHGRAEAALLARYGADCVWGKAE